jgi:hypothetical protein
MRHRGIVLVALAAAVFATGFGWQSEDFKRERGGATSALKDSLEGKPAPDIVGLEWANAGKSAPTWKGLKGKVVVMDFWAYW